MKTVFALFSYSKDADDAVSKLKDAGLDTEKARIHTRKTIESSRSVSAVPGAASGTPGTGNNLAGAAAPSGVGGGFITDDNVQSYLDKIRVPADQQAFFAHGLKDGGGLVHIDVADSEAEKAEQVLADAGGRAPQTE